MIRFPWPGSAPDVSESTAAPWYPDWLIWAGERTHVAIDFETDSASRDSACAVALVRVERGQIVKREARLIRPAKITEANSHIHGITRRQMAQAQGFAVVWPQLAHVWEGCSFFVAHNAPFDRSVLHTCCQAFGLEAPAQHFEDTVKLAKSVWPELPTHKLDVLSSHLGIELKHHDALSDALACAKIVMAARARVAQQLGDVEAFEGDGRELKRRAIGSSIADRLPVDQLPAHLVLEGHALRCTRCGGEVEHWCEDGAVLEIWAARFASQHPATGACAGRENRALRDQHYQDRGSLTAPALERPAWLPEEPAPVPSVAPAPVVPAVAVPATKPSVRKARVPAVDAVGSLFDTEKEVAS